LKFVQHIPPLAGVDPFEFEFATSDELLAHRWIARQSKDPGFYRFSLSNVVGIPILMLERNGGREYRVLGYIMEGERAALDLPDWQQPETRAIQ
jgi:hypothetical protein